MASASCPEDPAFAMAPHSAGASAARRRCSLTWAHTVGAGTLIDSHALVGSCAQWEATATFRAHPQIGGVIEPVGALPVIVR